MRGQRASAAAASSAHVQARAALAQLERQFRFEDNASDETLVGDRSYSYSYSYSEYESAYGSYISAGGSHGGEARADDDETAMLYHQLESHILDTPNYILALRVLRAMGSFDRTDAVGARAFWRLLDAATTLLARVLRHVKGTEAVRLVRLSAEELGQPGALARLVTHASAAPPRQAGGLQAATQGGRALASQARAHRHSLERHVQALERERDSLLAELREQSEAGSALPRRFYNATVEHHERVLQVAQAAIERREVHLHRLRKQLRNATFERRFG